MARFPVLGMRQQSFALLHLEDYAGKILVLHFSTSWCPFCNAEAPHLRQLWNDYRGRDVEVLVIDVMESPEAAASRANSEANATEAAPPPAVRRNSRRLVDPFIIPRL